MHKRFFLSLPLANALQCQSLLQMLGNALHKPRTFIPSDFFLKEQQQESPANQTAIFYE
jgi:hypothetical protein